MFTIKNNMIRTPEEYQTKYKKFVQIMNFSWNFWPQPRFSRAGLYFVTYMVQISNVVFFNLIQ